MPFTDWDQIRICLEEEGFPHHGFARLEKPMTLALYEAWLERDYAGEMEYLKRHLPMKRDPALLMKQAKSAIVVTAAYVPHPHPVAEFPLKEAKIARYAGGTDYHFWLKGRLNQVIERLKSTYPEHAFVAFTDSAPVLERDLAYRAGLGWVGKNTCLIDRARGSLFLIGEIFTTLELQAAELISPDFCGTCTRCLDVCPTGALVAPRELDARKCISYLTIESKNEPPPELRERMAGWFFGCDLCQTVCPWNVKLHGHQLRQAQQMERGTELNESGRDRLIEEMRLILTSSNSRLQKLFHGTPLVRAGAYGLKRNALSVCGAYKLTELIAEIEALQTHPRLAQFAAWTLTRLSQ